MSSIEREPLPVVLDLRGEQLFDQMEPDASKLMVDGTMEVTEQGLLLTYQEPELSGMEGTTTTLELNGPRVILTRRGAFCSQMIFEEGAPHSSRYQTPFGELSLEIRTSRLRHTLTERGGVLEICYAIAVEQTVTGQNRLRLRVIRKG